MQKPEDLASAASVFSTRDLKNRSAVLSRLAASLRAELDGIMSLSADERTCLGQAATLLEKMAQTQRRAAALIQNREKERAARASKVRPEVIRVCSALTSIEDRVAFVAFAGLSQRLKGSDPLQTAAQLDAEFQAAIEFMAHRITETTSPLPVREVVANMWNRFQDKRPRAIKDNAHLIDKLKLRAQAVSQA